MRVNLRFHVTVAVGGRHPATKCAIPGHYVEFMSNRLCAQSGGRADGITGSVECWPKDNI